MKDKDKQRIQQQVGGSTDDDRKHTCGGIALGVDKRIHAGGDHGGDRAEQIDHQIGVGVDDGIFGGSEQKQDRAGKDKTDHHQAGAAGQKHGEGGIHQKTGSFPVAFTAGNGKERCAAGAKEIAAGGDDHNNRKA